MAYKLVKQFDCQDMPNDVSRCFFEETQGAGNDCLVKWYFGKEDIEDNSEFSPGRASIDNWLLENGAEPGDNIVISHWW